MRVIIASNNKGKIKEFSKLLKDAGFDEILSLEQAGISSMPEETGESFEENARIKARAVRSLCGDCAVIADDSGLTVDALDGEPGIYSARYGGLETDEQRNSLILRRLEGVTKSKRTAAFVCTICFIGSGGNELTVRGECRGCIGFEPIGENGFGYDPIFICTDPPFSERSFAQLRDEEKNLISHRARAMEKLKAQLNVKEN